MPPQQTYIALLHLGFSPNEAKTYEALLSRSAASVPELSKKLGLHRRNVYDALDRLEKKKFVTRTLGAGADQYVALSPRNILFDHTKKEKEFLSILPLLEATRKEAEKKRAEQQIAFQTVDSPFSIFEKLSQSSSEISSINFPFPKQIHQFRAAIKDLLTERSPNSWKWTLYVEKDEKEEKNIVAELKRFPLQCSIRRTQKAQLPAFAVTENVLVLIVNDNASSGVLIESPVIAKKYLTMLKALT